MTRRHLLAATALLASGRIAAAPESPRVPRAVLDLALEPATIDTAPGPRYSDEQRDYAMVIGADRTPGGRIWAAWVAGGDSDLGYFVLASSDDDGATWSKPRLVIDPPDAPTGLKRRILVGNLWTDPAGRLWLLYDQSMGYYDGRAGVWATVCDNPDADRPVWSAPRRIWHGATLNKPTVLRNGDWLLPISLWTRDRIGPGELRGAYPELDDQRMAHVFVSTDRGTTWTRRGGVRIPQTDFDEHMMVERADGTLWMLARTTYGIAETVSSDGGRTWSEPKPSAIRNPSTRFFLRRLRSGRLLLVKNGPLDERIGRARMTAFLSEDDGRTWGGGLVLDERDGVSYPDGFESPDGVIHVIYDRNRGGDREILMARFREEDVAAGGFTVAGSRAKMLVSKAYGPRIGPVLYNGIRLPGQWPPASGDPGSTDPMPVPYRNAPPAVIPIDVGRQLFVDDFLVAETDMARTFHHARRYEGNPVLRPETARELAASDGGEGRQEAVCYLGHGGVFYDPADRLFKMFYTAGWRGGLAMATSTDAVHWTRPEIDGTGGNLLLPVGRTDAGGDNAVWLDLGAKNPAERIKLLADQGPHTLRMSADGRNWSDPVPTGKAGDYCSFFYNPFRRVWVFSIKRDGPRGRCRYYSEHADFLKGADWSKAVYWTNADRLDRADPKIGDAPQLYSLNAVAYESLMLGMFYIHLGPDNRVCEEGRFPKTTQLMLGFSRDGFHWDRPDRAPFLAPTGRDGDWDRGYLHGTMGVCLVVGDTLIFPYTGFSGIAPSGARGMYSGASVGLAMLRRDGFASMNAGAQTRTLLTRPVAFSGRHLFVNVDCPRGELRVEALDESGKAIAPFTASNCEPITADGTLLPVRWKGVDDLSVLAGKPVRFRFLLKRGSLYAFWVSPSESGASYGYVGAGGPGYAGTLDTTGAPQG